MTTRNYEPAAKKRMVVKLSREAFKTVEENAGGIALALLESTKKGMVMSAKLLVELAERNVDVEEGTTAGPLRSLALRLAAEPQLKRPSLVVDSNPETQKPT
jgi:hypothetical protein